MIAIARRLRAAESMLNVCAWWVCSPVFLRSQPAPSIRFSWIPPSSATHAALPAIAQWKSQKSVWTRFLNCGFLGSTPLPPGAAPRTFVQL